MTVLLKNSNPAKPKKRVVSIYRIGENKFHFFNYLKIKYFS
ncbi:hypothetical protein D1BOALGB6SA_9047 [Olavius sp. associated proteobacterium Delta 1]|nr:hypothetical protein D1BOALGB6SA_9047 [Olavius sp. associated proteobacterium Delta 1]